VIEQSGDKMKIDVPDGFVPWEKKRKAQSKSRRDATAQRIAKLLFDGMLSWKPTSPKAQVLRCLIA
jgi:hypothetical protein